MEWNNIKNYGIGGQNVNITAINIQNGQIVGYGKPKEIDRYFSDNLDNIYWYKKNDLPSIYLNEYITLKPIEYTLTLEFPKTNFSQKTTFTPKETYKINGIALDFNVLNVSNSETANLKIEGPSIIEAIFTTTTTTVTEFAESVSTSVSAVGGMFYQGGQMTFLGTLSLLTAGTLLVMWAVRTIRRLIGR